MSSHSPCGREYRMYIESMNEERKLKVAENARRWKRATNYNEKRREAKRVRRLMLLKHYSGSETPFCACCNEMHYEFLALDHKDGGGNEHRRKVWGRNRGGGTDTADWVIKNNYPPLFQVLCHNCNMSSSFYGSCPHKR